jgi:hypothetical protein
MTAPKGLLLVDIVVDADREDEFNRWYDEEHIPDKRAAAGFHSARRFKHHSDPHRYLAVYEVDDADTVTSSAYMTSYQSPWSLSIQEAWKEFNRSVWEEVTQP